MYKRNKKRSIKKKEEGIFLYQLSLLILNSESTKRRPRELRRRAVTYYPIILFHCYPSLQRHLIILRGARQDLSLRGRVDISYREVPYERSISRTTP